MSEQGWTNHAEIGTEIAGRGRVCGVSHDGVIVRLENSSVAQDVPCDIMENAGGRLALAVGDSVLVWRSTLPDERGVILGRIGAPQSVPDDEPASMSGGATPLPAVQASDDVPDEIVIEARKNLTLKCGEGSITIRADGKILIRGRDLVSHAKRMNRVRGGSVAIN